jgi:threonine dehydrogenase-like Zn-dependent dehydrogenase
MRAIRFDGKLQFIKDHPAPTPGARECVVKVHLAGICSTDLEIIRGYMGFTGILGHEMVGTVERGSSNWKGKRVVAEINCVCRTCDMCQSGLAHHCRQRTVLGIAGRDGCFADYVAVPERNLHEVPDSVSDQEAVFVEPLAAAWQVVKQVPVEPRTHVAVIGSGRLGLLVSQILNTFGCRLEVIGRNRRSLALCEKRHLQAVHVNDVVIRRDRDLVVECSGSPAGLELALGLVRPRGTIVLKSTYSGGGPIDLAPAVVNEISIVGSRCGPFADAIACLARKEVDVLSMVSRTMDIERASDALDAAADKDNLKILLKINPR